MSNTGLATDALSKGLEVLSTAQQELEGARAKVRGLESRLESQEKALRAAQSVFTAWAKSLRFEIDGKAQVKGYVYKDEAPVTPGQMNDLINEAATTVARVLREADGR